MDIIKTVDGVVEYEDPIYQSQKADVAKMREALLVCSDGNTGVAKQALNNITVLRVYHQISRIIKYTEMCDKIEQKIYESLDNTLNNSNPNSPSTWMMLMEAQERLQKLLIESQKLLQPYMDLDSFKIMDITSDTSDIPAAVSMNSDMRAQIQSKAQAVMLQLVKSGNVADV